MFSMPFYAQLTQVMTSVGRVEIYSVMIISLWVSWQI